MQIFLGELGEGKQGVLWEMCKSQILWNNRPISSFPKTLFQSEANCEAIDMEVIFYSQAN